MNSLSWMIYLAEVAGSLSAFFGIFGVVGFVIGSISFIVLAVEDGPEVARYFRWPAAILTAFILIACVLPSKATIYAIAASEMGEKALNTPTAGKAVKALDAWLDKQIAGDAERKGEGN